MKDVIYFESHFLKQQYVKQWKRRAPLFHYELQDKQRLLSAITSQYFSFAVFIFDHFTVEHQNWIQNLEVCQQGLPFFVIANHYVNAKAFEVMAQQNPLVHYFTSNEIVDLPGIILRVLKQKNYYQRNYQRAMISQSAELAIDNKVLPVTIKNLSRGGAKVELRCDPKTITQKQAVLIHTLQDGKQTKIPLELCWAGTTSDGRLQIGTKFHKYN